MGRTRQKYLSLVVGWTFIVLGILGLFLPVLQGILFLMIGLVILSSEYVWAHAVLSKLRARFPRVASTFHEASERARAWIRHEPTRTHD
jgi:uncharacterized membrane protein YbaN (DUF454 family)